MFRRAFRGPGTSDLPPQRRAAVTDFVIQDVSLVKWLDNQLELRKQYPINEADAPDPSVVPQIVGAARNFALAVQEAIRRYEALAPTIAIPVVQAYYKARRDAYAADARWAAANHEAWVAVASGKSPRRGRPNSIKQRLKASRLFLKLNALFPLDEFEDRRMMEAVRRYVADSDWEPSPHQTRA